MENALYLPTPDVLNTLDGETLCHGGNQDWYKTHWRREAGCGLTNCANLILYLAKTRTGCGALCPYNTAEKTGFLQLMEDMWFYVTPGNMGVNTTDIFTLGAERYGKAKGVPLTAQSLAIEHLQIKKREYRHVSQFIRQALTRNLPIAFLNLSNGTLQNLDSWHWVTLVGLRGHEAMIYDQGSVKWIDLRQWLASSLMGGGFVTVEPARSMP